MLVAMMVFAASAHPAYAADKVDCNAVMSELNSGKHPKQVAKDLSIATSSVCRCKRQAHAAAKASTKTSLHPRSGREAKVAASTAPSHASHATSATTKHAVHSMGLGNGRPILA